MAPPASLGRATIQRKTVEERAVLDSEPLPESGSLIGTLMNMKKADLELAAGSPAEVAAINERYDAIQTRGDARTYIESVMQKVGVAQEQRKVAKAARKTRPTT